MITFNISQNCHSVDLITRILKHPCLSLDVLSNKATGKYTAEGEDWFYIISEGVTAESINNQAEFHKEYGDIQMVIQGIEMIEFSNLRPDREEINTQATTPDLFFIPAHQTQSKVILNEGDYAVFYPSEIHKPMCNTADGSHHVKKVVVKFPCKLFFEPTLSL